MGILDSAVRYIICHEYHQNYVHRAGGELPVQKNIIMNISIFSLCYGLLYCPDTEASLLKSMTMDDNQQEPLCLKE